MSAYMLFCKDRRAALQEEGNSQFRWFNCYFTQLIFFMLELELPSFSLEVRFILFVFVCRCGLQRYWSNARETMARNRCADQEGSLDKIKLWVAESFASDLDCRYICLNCCPVRRNTPTWLKRTGSATKRRLEVNSRFAFDGKGYQC